MFGRTCTQTETKSIHLTTDLGLYFHYMIRNVDKYQFECFTVHVLFFFQFFLIVLFLNMIRNLETELWFEFKTYTIKKLHHKNKYTAQIDRTPQG